MTPEEVTIVHQALALIDTLGVKDPNFKEHCTRVSHEIRRVLMRNILREFVDEAKHQGQGGVVHKTHPSN